MKINFRASSTWLNSLVALTTVLIATQASAQVSKPNHEGWYQVELIVFARKDDSAQEHWPDNIKLRYPGDWVELKDPAANDKEDNPATSVDLTKEAFYVLPSGERQLNAQAKKLENNPRYELLFHQAWRQVISNKKSSKAILINGGRQFGQHQTLEGSIRLSVATYLELQTNLWYSQFDVNVGQEITRQWPAIPLRPNYSKANANGLSLDSNFEFDQALAAENQQWSGGGFNTADAANSNDTTAPEYVTRQIILLQQERDMRSGEVHYLDHPVLAAIIQVTPYSQIAR